MTMNKKLFVIMLVALVLCFAGYAAAYSKSALPSKPITIEGTIQGLQGACMGVYCKVGEENITAAMEDEFVLVTGDGSFYSLPNVKSMLLARYIARMIRVSGDEILGGKAILVHTAEVMDKGKWTAFWSPEIADQVKYRKGTP